MGVLHTARLLVRIRLKRLVNMFAVSFRRKRRVEQQGVRRATPSKYRIRWLLMGGLGLIMLWQFGWLAYMAVSNLNRALGTVEVKEADGKTPLQAKRHRIEADIRELEEKIENLRAQAESEDDYQLTNELLEKVFELETELSARKSDLAILKLDEKWQRVMNKYREPPRKPLPHAPGMALAPGVLKGASLLFLLAFVATLVMTVSNKDITRPQWDMEWLATLPIPVPVLLGSRMIERAVVNFIGFFTIVMPAVMLAWHCGYRASAPLVGLLVGFPLLLVVGAFSVLIDTCMRFAFSPARLRNFQALLIILGMLLFLAVMAPALSRSPDSFFFRLARSTPSWLLWLPTGLPVKAVASESPVMALLVFALLAAFVAGVAALSFRLLSWRLKDGVIAGGVRESTRAIRRPSTKILHASRKFLSAIQAKELRLLARDRTFLIQTLIVPVFILGVQFIANPGLLKGLAGNPRNLGAAAFAVAGYTFMFSAFNVLNSEGKALWLIYTLPHRLEAIVMQKVVLWGLLGLLYPAVILAAGFCVGHVPQLEALKVTVIVLVGVPIYAVIAACIGVFGSRPLEPRQRRVRASHLYLYMLLGALYLYAIFAPGFYQQLGMVILMALLALALWQKARDHLPYMLDPTATPKPRVSLADGLIAVVVFSVIQGVVLAGFAIECASSKVPFEAVFIAFAVAGGCTYIFMRLVFLFRKTKGVPRVLGRNISGAIWTGLLFGLAASLLAQVYLSIVWRVESLSQYLPPALDLKLTGRILLPCMAIVLAPIFEEFIFRGLVFGGLRRSRGLLLSVLASAAIFALAHPPVSALPVFCLGVCTALAYERSRSLLAPMIAHAVYNAVIVGFQYLA